MVLPMLNHWYILCRTKELKKKPLARTVCSEAVVGFRNAEGEACVLQDRCAHRNMALSRGSVTEHGIRCSYHGWAYAGDGHCADIPASCESCEAYSKIKIRSYPVREKQDMVWLWMGKDLPVDEPIDFPQFETSGWHHWFMQREFEGNAPRHTGLNHDVQTADVGKEPEYVLDVAVFEIEADELTGVLGLTQVTAGYSIGPSGNRALGGFLRWRGGG